MADKKETVIEIPAIQLEVMTVRIIGKTPLITHKFGDKAQKSIEDKQQKKAKTAREAREPEVEWKDALYVIDEENEKYGFPASGIKKSLVNAGGRFADEKMTVLRGAVNIVGDLLEIEGNKPEMRTDAVRLNGGSLDLRYRPEFKNWSINVPVIFNSNIISKSQVLNLFQIAGFAVGLGDWRPEKNGTFGQFEIDKDGVSA
jgi:hypothetical protein